MAKQSGLGDHLFVDGYDLSGDIGSLSRIGGGPMALEVTAIDKSAPERVGGLRTGAIEFSSWFNPSAAQAHQVLKLIPTTDIQVSYLKGFGIGNAAASQISKQVGYDPTRGQDGSLSMAISAQSNGYGLEWGKQLTNGKRTDTTATSPATGLDGLASSTFGGQVYLHLFAFTGTSVTVTLQDSADNSTFAAIGGGVSFAAASAVGAQRIAFTGTVRRYVRAITTGTFTNAVFAVNFIRNETAVVF